MTGIGCLKCMLCCAKNRESSVRLDKDIKKTIKKTPLREKRRLNLW